MTAVSLTFALAGCSSSSRPAGSADPTTAQTAAPVVATTTTTLAPLSGSHSIDIKWTLTSLASASCPTGLTGSCSVVHATGDDATLGALALVEYVSTPAADSCSTAAVQGTVTRNDSIGSTLTYTGKGQFCWANTTGSFNLTPASGTGQLAGTTGSLVAKVTTTSNETLDEWTGTLTFGS